MQGDLSHSAESHVDKLSGMADDSNPSHPVAKSKVVNRSVHLDLTNIPIPRTPPEEVQQSPRRQHVPDSSPPTAADAGGLQPSVTLQSGKSGGLPAIDLVDSPRPKHQARDKAIDLIKKCNAQGKKRSRSLRGSPQPPASRRKAPAKTVRVREQTSVDNVEDPPVAHNEAISSTKSTHFIALMIFDYTDIHFTVSTQELGSIRSNTKLFNLSVSVDDKDLCSPLKELLKKLTSTISPETVPLHEARLLGALWKQEELQIAIALKEGHIAALRNGLNNWGTMTEAARQELGKYRKQEEIQGTLRYEEDSLLRLKYKLNSVQYQIKTLRRMGNSTRGVTSASVAEESQEERSAKGNWEINTDEEVDRVLG